MKIDEVRRILTIGDAQLTANAAFLKTRMDLILPENLL